MPSMAASSAAVFFDPLGFDVSSAAGSDDLKDFFGLGGEEIDDEPLFLTCGDGTIHQFFRNVARAA